MVRFRLTCFLGNLAAPHTGQLRLPLPFFSTTRCAR